MAEEKRYRVARLDRIDPASCPCGTTRRAFTDRPRGPASLHVVEIHADARVHYHRRQSEIYYVLEGEGHIELDGDRVEARCGTAVMIEPGCRHRAVGTLRILNVVVPPFDPEDEWFDE